MIAALHAWHEFYILLGTAAATLLGLLFVATSLGAGVLTTKSVVPTRTYMSPVVIHFAAIFFMSSVTLMPGIDATAFSVVSGATALVGIAISASICWRLVAGFENIVRDPADHLGYGLLPLIAYGGLLAAAIMSLHQVEWPLDLLAAALMLLLMVNIRNTWDLTLSMVRRQSERRRR